MIKIVLSQHGMEFYRKYFASSDEANEYVNYYNSNFGDSHHCAKIVGEVNMKFHHSSLGKGYIAKGHGRDESYNGEFGVGFIKHIPNAECSVNTTNYHVIEYYVES